MFNFTYKMGGKVQKALIYLAWCYSQSRLLLILNMHNVQQPNETILLWQQLFCYFIGKWNGSKFSYISFRYVRPVNTFPIGPDNELWLRFLQEKLSQVDHVNNNNLNKQIRQLGDRQLTCDEDFSWKLRSRVYFG